MATKRAYAAGEYDSTTDSIGINVQRIRYKIEQQNNSETSSTHNTGLRGRNSRGSGSKILQSRELENDLRVIVTHELQHAVQTF